MTRARSSISMLLAAALLTACGDSTSLVGELTEAEAGDLAAALFTTAFLGASAAPSGPSPAPAGPQAAPYMFTRQAQFTVQCAHGGSVDVEASLEGEGDTETGAGRIDYSMTQVHRECQVTTERGVVFTLDGAPDVTAELVAENDGQGNLSLSGSVEGRIEWATDRRGGVCEIVITFTGTVNDAEQTAEFGVSGVVCRVSIQQSGAIG